METQARERGARSLPNASFEWIARDGWRAVVICMS
jgi:hypothetical protein